MKIGLYTYEIYKNCTVLLYLIDLQKKMARNLIKFDFVFFY